MTAYCWYGLAGITFKCVVYIYSNSNKNNFEHPRKVYRFLNEFKTRFNLRMSSFKLEYMRTSTTLNDHIWKLKNKNINFNIKWEVIKKVKPFTPGDKVCKLCLQEKLSILRSVPSLNKKKNIKFGHCMHKKRFQLDHNHNILLSDEVPIMDPKF